MDSPLAKIQRPRKTAYKSPPIPIPETLRLPDGREFKTRDLLNKRSGNANYNLRSKSPSQPIKQVVKTKYSASDWVWMATAMPDDIMKRYGVNENYAMVLRTKGRNFINSPEWQTKL
jgi:hypothetical protein